MWYAPWSFNTHTELESDPYSCRAPLIHPLTRSSPTRCRARKVCQVGMNAGSAQGASRPASHSSLYVKSHKEKGVGSSTTFDFIASSLLPEHGPAGLFHYVAISTASVWSIYILAKCWLVIIFKISIRLQAL